MASRPRFALEAVYAGKGDALILHHGTTGRPKWSLIDGGHRNVYHPFLRPRFEQLMLEHPRSVRDGRLPLEMIMVSHADEDHLMGLLDLKTQLEGDADGSNPPLDHAPISVREIWLNGFDDLAFGDLDPADTDTTSIATAVVAGASGGRGIPLAPADRADDELTAVIASTGQCRELRDFARRLDVDFNKEFGGGLIRRDAPGVDTKDLRAISGVEMTVLGPDDDRITKFRAKWKQDLKKILENERSEVEAFSDRSPHNLASIMVLLERGGKTMLLTGDCRGDHLVEGLVAQGKLDAVDGDDVLHVDLFKVPHHGSSRNAKRETFERIVADHYVISANGEHHNPDVELLTMLAEGREAARPSVPYKVHLTFPVRAFEAITDEMANRSTKRRKQRDALLAVHEWMLNDRPDTFEAVFRGEDELSVTVDLLP